MEQYEIYVSFEADEEGVVAYCDELNAVASGHTQGEAQQNLLLAIQNMLDDYNGPPALQSEVLPAETLQSSEIRRHLPGRVLGFKKER